MSFSYPSPTPEVTGDKQESPRYLEWSRGSAKGPVSRKSVGKSLPNFTILDVKRRVGLTTGRGGRASRIEPSKGVSHLSLS